MFTEFKNMAGGVLFIAYLFSWKGKDYAII